MDVDAFIFLFLTAAPTAGLVRGLAVLVMLDVACSVVVVVVDTSDAAFAASAAGIVVLLSPIPSLIFVIDSSPLMISVISIY